MLARACHTIGLEGTVNVFHHSPKSTSFSTNDSISGTDVHNAIARSIQRQTDD